MSTLALFTLFMLKHFVVDFLLQGSYMYKNKGTYLHPGGIYHAALHGYVSSLIICFYYTDNIALIMGIFEFLIHYHIDWAKVNINKKFNLKPNNSEKFWWLLGLDQLLHNLTYILMIYICQSF